jgi:hypothetical protein
LVQRQTWVWDVFCFTPTGTLTGFGEEGKILLRKIAHELRGFHLGKFYCGSLFKNIRISHDLNVTFSKHPILAKDDSELRNGIMIDTLQFRRLVAKTMTNELDKSILQSLPMGILLFFFFQKFLLISFN